MRATHVLLLVAALAAGCGGGADSTPAPGGEGTAQGEPLPPIAPMPRLQVAVYFPAASGEGLVAETREIFDTATAVDRIKQIVADLLSGPAAERGLRAIPRETQLRQAYILDGVAWLDFNAALKSIGGGSLEELLVVYSIVNSVALNVDEIERVGFLVDGRPIETLNGHLDLTDPIAPDRSMILGEGPGPTAARVP